MRLADVKTVIEPVVDPDVTFAAFREATGTEEPEKFLAYLKDKALVTDSQFATLHADDAIEVTEVVAFSRLPRRGAGPGAQETVLDGAGEKSLPPTLSVESVAPAGSGMDPGRASDPDAPAAAAPPRPALRYELLGTVGRGGMGLVYVARDLDLRRKVALKQLGPEMAAHSEALSRFVKEVQITAQLDHPHIVPVYGLEASPDGALGYAMKLVQGKTFADLVEETREALREGRPLDEGHSLPARLDHFLKVCDAIAYAHGKGVLHRDLKPANLMIGRYHEVYVMDWGLARLIGRREEAEPMDLGAVAEADSRVAQTRLGTVVGTPRYMSPEQVTDPSDALDGRSDEYALGLILYELVTLGPAVGGETVTEVVRAAMEGRKNPVVAAVEGAEVPPDLVAIIDKATARGREDRYPGVAELAADVRRHLRDEEILARPDTRTQRLARLIARNRKATLGLVAALVLVSVLGFLFLLWRRQVAQEEARLREARLERFMSDVSGNAEAIDAHFLQLQGLLQGLAGAAEHALVFGVPSREAYAVPADLGDAKRRLPDAFFSKRYGSWVSAEHPVWVVPKRSPPSVLEEARRLLPLRRMRRRLFLESQGRAATVENDVPPRELLDSPELPLVWTLIGLQSGLGSVYPGTGAVPPGWDPRERPWYRDAVKALGPVWGAPHLDRFGTGLVFACSVPLHDEKGRFLGVAAVDLSFDRVARTLLAVRGHPSVEESFMLDANGGVLVRSGKSARVDFDEKGDMKVEPFPYLTLLPGVLKTETGSADVRLGGKARLVVWRRLAALGGVSYAVVADRDLLVRGEKVAVVRRLTRRGG